MSCSKMEKVNFQLLCDVSLLKHAQISTTWYGIKHKKVSCIIYNII